VLLGLLAVSLPYQGQGLGGVLSEMHRRRPARAEFGVFARVVDARDESDARFYKHHGFYPLPGEQRRLRLPISPLFDVWRPGKKVRAFGK
jgi:predicted N-acetyltransferase YhbS